MQGRKQPENRLLNTLYSVSVEASICLSLSCLNGKQSRLVPTGHKLLLLWSLPMKCPSGQRSLCLISSGLGVTWCSCPFFIPCPRWADYPATRAPFTLELCSKGVIYWVDQKVHSGFSITSYRKPKWTF